MRGHIMVCLLILLLGGGIVSAQKEYNIWYSSCGSGIDFNGPTPVSLSDGQSGTQSARIAGMCDRRTGELLFYTDGNIVWTDRHEIMPGGARIGDFVNDVVIVPMPGDSLGYYIFASSPVTWHGLRNALAYSTVDMRQFGDSGAVMAINIPLMADSVNMGICAVGHCNGHDYWVITQGNTTSRFYSYLVTDSGISGPVVSQAGSAATVTNSQFRHLEASPNGRMLVRSREFNYIPSMELFRFDNATGIVSNGITFRSDYDRLHWHSGANHGAAASFSSDNTKLYATRSFRKPYSTSETEGGFYQYDVSRYDSAVIAASQYRLQTWESKGGYGMQMGPDGKLYVGLYGNLLYQIDYPNVAGGGCGFHLSPLSGACSGSLPNNIDGLLDPQRKEMSAGPDVAICIGEYTTLRASGGTKYRWSPSTALSCTNCPQPVARPSQTTTYQVEIANDGGCSRIEFVTVTVSPRPVADAGEGDTICRGEPLQLAASEAATWQWSPAAGLSCTDCRNPVARPTTTTTYTLTVTSDAGCSAKDSVRVVVLDVPVVDAGTARTICAGDSVQLKATGGSDYHWLPAEGLSCTDCANPIARPTATTLYTVAVNGDNGCTATDTVSVHVVNLPTADAGVSQSLCRGDSITLTASTTGASSWQWSPSAGLSCTDCESPMASPSVTTLYTLRATNAAGCTASDTVSVTVFDLPVIDAGADVKICTGDSAHLTATGATAYHWSPGAGLSCVDCPNPVARPVVTTMYHVTTVGANGCSAIDSVLVTVIGAGSVDAGIAQPVCRGDSVQLQASDGAAWQWSPATGLSCTDCRSPIAHPSATTLYTVTVSAAGCSASDTVTVTVLDVPEIDAGPDVSICTGSTAQLHASGGVSYQWSPAGGLSCTDCADPIASPTATTVYRVTGRGAEGCPATDSVRVEVGSQQVVRGHIGRDYRAFPAAPLRIPVVLDNAITAPGIDTMEIDLKYDINILRMNGVRLDDGLLSGWQLEPLSTTLGNYRARIVAPTGVEAHGSGTLLTLEMAAFLGDSLASELPMTVKLIGSECQQVEISPGRVALDSVCGMTLRLVRISADKYSLSQNDPNPFNPATRIAFSLAFDGPARLEVFDAAGNRVAMLIDEQMAAGSYEAVWDASNAASGVYYYRLTSGTWSATRSMVVVK